MYDLAGAAIYDSSPLQRRFRDAFTPPLIFRSTGVAQAAGRILLDQPADGRCCDRTYRSRPAVLARPARREASRWRPVKRVLTRCGLADGH
jgi:hypothetical protein